MICTTSLLLYGIYIKFTSAVPPLLLPSSGPPSRQSAHINMYKSLFGGKTELRNGKESLKGLTSLASSRDRRQSTHNPPGEGQERPENKITNQLFLVEDVTCSSDVSPERKTQNEVRDVDFLHFVTPDVL